MGMLPQAGLTSGRLGGYVGNPHQYRIPRCGLSHTRACTTARPGRTAGSRVPARHLRRPSHEFIMLIPSGNFGRGTDRRGAYSPMGTTLISSKYLRVLCHSSPAPASQMPVHQRAHSLLETGQ
ncbi:MAG: hypothetical protein AMXMBFR13_22930 [Phycisphaerae bacterium]